MLPRCAVCHCEPASLQRSDVNSSFEWDGLTIRLPGFLHDCLCLWLIQSSPCEWFNCFASTCYPPSLIGNPYILSVSVLTSISVHAFLWGVVGASRGHKKFSKKAAERRNVSAEAGAGAAQTFFSLFRGPVSVRAPKPPWKEGNPDVAAAHKVSASLQGCLALPSCLVSLSGWQCELIQAVDVTTRAKRNAREVDTTSAGTVLLSVQLRMTFLPKDMGKKQKKVRGLVFVHL